MSSPAETLLSTPTESDDFESINPITTDNFYLVHRETKVYTPSKAPMYIFDIVDKNEIRLGRIHTIIEPNPNKVHDCGHICGFMLKGKENPELLAEAALELEKISSQRGVSFFRYVIPHDCKESIEALGKRGLSDPVETLESDNMQMLVYECDH